jgi:regulator of sigma E protease
LNLLPIPVLDGGLILFSLLAVIFRRRVPEKFIKAVSMFFMAVLFALMMILVFRDSVRSYRIHSHSNAVQDTSHAEKGAK